jgi:hypothetical protein
MKKVAFLVLLLIQIAFFDDLNAQCPMCKGSAEASLKEGQPQARGLNKGILYMFVGPYLIVGTIAGLWLYNKKKMEKQVKDKMEYTFTKN